MSIVQKLQREMNASPAKAAGLGLGIVVAIYFWAPLVKGFIWSDAPAAPPVPAAPPAAAAPAVAAAPVAPAAPGATPPATAAPGYDWQRYAQMIDEDVRMQSSGELPNARDPFESQNVALPAE